MGDHPYIFFVNDTATTEIYTLSLHDALPIFASIKAYTWLPAGWSFPDDAESQFAEELRRRLPESAWGFVAEDGDRLRSEEHTSELQSTPISRMPSSA